MSFSINPLSGTERQSYIFEPKEDITPYEIAQLLPFLVAAWRNATDVYQIERKRMPSGWSIASLPESLRRHFKELS